MSGHDPIELLRELGRAQRASFESTADADQLLARLGARKRGRFRAWLRRRRRIVAGIIAVLVGAGGGTVAWAIIHRERATSPTMIGCYQGATTDGSLLVIDNDGSDPAAQCAAAWPRLMPDWGAPPLLVACKGDNGAPAVFPGTEQTCLDLGLAVLDPSLTTEQQRYIEFREAVRTTIGESGCLPPNEVETLVRGQLQAFRISGWTIEISGEYTTAEPCGGPGFDESTRTIYILPLADHFETGQED